MMLLVALGAWIEAAQAYVHVVQRRTSPQPEVTRYDFAIACAAALGRSGPDAYRQADLTECSRAAHGVALAAQQAGRRPRIKLLDGCAAAAQLHDTCSANDGPVLAVDY
jgi:hypothetical protein